ncbi:beta-galactosidase trimerization domain-containing protein, partial [candidate division KSB1 bacterium]|nr:beta-galactosidase trimerization domain-containing protein [candidate division KSB1 bacterium]
LDFAAQMLDGFKAEMSALVRQTHPDCSIFYNAGHVGPATRTSVDSYSHLELESLPSSGHWGYLHFPYSIRFARGLGLACIGMTGKFHTEWGDFHSFKNPQALEFECFQMLAHGVGCSIGDQLHPDGALCPHVYERIGRVYEQVAAKEPWCRGARPVTEIAVFTPEEWSGEQLPAAAQGAVRMLQETALQFDIIDSHSDLGTYKLLILPDRIPVDDRLARKLNACFAAGGKALITFESGLDPSGRAFALSEFGVERAADQVCDESGNPVRGRYFEQHDYIDYILPHAPVAGDLAETEYALYTVGLRVEPTAQSTVWAETILPYFYRSWQRFCSHRQTPSCGKSAGAAIVATERSVYFSHPIFEIYQRWAPRWCKSLVVNAIDRLLGERLVRHTGPSTLLITLTDQPGRRNVHLLHYIPERRCEKIDIIQDIIPLYDIELSVAVDRPVRRVTSVPRGSALTFRQETGRAEFVLPLLRGHQIIEIQFEE